MTSETRFNEAYVWVWLPGATEPVVAGLLFREGNRLMFIYGQSYLERPNAIALFEPELSLKRGLISPAAGLTMAGCLRDAAPDAWGRRCLNSLENYFIGSRKPDRSGLCRDHLKVW
jgi:serine/threonine-protein kinase HipA